MTSEVAVRRVPSISSTPVARPSAPTTSRALAEACALVAAGWLADSSPGAAHDALLDGTYHATCAGSTTWCGFARAIVQRLDPIARALGEPVPARRPTVTAIGTADYPTPARRPANSVLDNGKLARRFGVALPHWESALDALLAEPRPPRAR